MSRCGSSCDPRTTSWRSWSGRTTCLRRLSLIRVDDVRQPLDPAAEQRIPATADLRTALGMLVESGTISLVVVDDDGVATGSVNLGTIQEASATGELAKAPSP